MGKSCKANNTTFQATPGNIENQVYLDRATVRVAVAKRISILPPIPIMHIITYAEILSSIF